jgi:hypothetical protein
MFVRDFAALASRIEPAVAEPREHVLYAAARSSSSSRRRRQTSRGGSCEPCKFRS